jgi:hypothetical protein
MLVTSSGSTETSMAQSQTADREREAEAMAPRGGNDFLSAPYYRNSLGASFAGALGDENRVRSGRGMRTLTASEYLQTWARQLDGQASATGGPGPRAAGDRPAGAHAAADAPIDTAAIYAKANEHYRDPRTAGGAP